MPIDLASLAQALSDLSRLRLLGILREGEWCGCHLAEILELTPATVSRHITILRRAGLVEARKEGRWLHCSLAKPKADSPESGLLEWLDKAQAGDRTLKADVRRLKSMVKECTPACCS